MANYLKKRGQKFHFQKRVPTAFHSLFPKRFVQVPLGTDSEAVALQRAHNFNLILEDFWQTLVGLTVDEARAKFQAAVLNAKICGFQYKSKQALVEHAPLAEFINRINTADITTDDLAKSAFLGGVKLPEITISKARDEFFSYEEGNLRGLSENQIRKWRNPRKKAIKNFIKVIGNKCLESLERKDILDFRTWWINRIKTYDLAANTANKEFGFIKKIIDTAVDNHALDVSVDSLFKKVALKKVEKSRRYPFSKTFIKDTLFKLEADGLNLEAQLLIFAMSDTGARIAELVGLDDSDIFLDTKIPYISIRPNHTRTLKTVQSERDLPLVGASLYAFQMLGGSFKIYHGKPDLISTTINKYCRENNIFPSKNHSLYSLRHSFEDRLTAVEPPDKVQAALMGHKYVRPRYGDGPSLEQKKLWLDKIAFKI